MHGTQPTDALNTLTNSALSGVVFEGLTATTRDGRPARLAIIDEAGNVLDAGPQVARACWAVMRAVHDNYLQAQGHLRVLTQPTGGVVTLPPAHRKTPTRKTA